MNWQKKGLIFEPSESVNWMNSHCQLPTPLMLSDELIRVYFASRDENQISGIGFCDYNTHLEKVVFFSSSPVLVHGGIGTFDEHGVFPSCVVKNGDRLFMYYIGWNKGCEQPLFYANIGLAISEDGGDSFNKYSLAPIMSRSVFDPCLVTSPNVYFDEGKWRMTYVSGVKWERVNGRLKSYYHIKYAQSNDGIHWERNGEICIDFINSDESNIARSSVLKFKDKYRMWYCYVSDGNPYRLGYAESKNGINWHRKDSSVGLSASENGFDSDMICYPSVIRNSNWLFMFYNGNNYGKDGVGLAISQDYI